MSGLKESSRLKTDTKKTYGSHDCLSPLDGSAIWTAHLAGRLLGKWKIPHFLRTFIFQFLMQQSWKVLTLIYVKRFVGLFDMGNPMAL